MADTVIQVDNLVAKYGERTVLHDVSTTFNSSEIKVVLGTSGCGKTTFLKHTILGVTYLRHHKSTYSQI